MADAPMPTTCVTLLARLGQDPTDQVAWDVFAERFCRGAPHNRVAMPRPFPFPSGRAVGRTDTL